MTNKGYKLRVPFKIGPGRELIDFNDSYEKVIDSYKWKFTHKKPYCIIEISEFNNQEAALNYFNSVRYSLMYTQMKEKLSLNVENVSETIVYSKDPETANRNHEKNMKISEKGPIPGILEYTKPAILPMGQNFITVQTGIHSVVISLPLSGIIKSLEEAISLKPVGQRVKINDKLQTALDLYSAYWYEISNNAKFLTLIMALESLILLPQKYKIALDFIKKWKLELEAEKNKYGKDSEEYSSLESLGRELLFRKTASLRQGIRKLILDTIKDDSKNDLANDAVHVYDLRSTLVHAGFLSKSTIENAIQRAKNIVEIVVLTKLKET